MSGAAQDSVGRDDAGGNSGDGSGDYADAASAAAAAAAAAAAVAAAEEAERQRLRAEEQQVSVVDACTTTFFKAALPQLIRFLSLTTTTVFKKENLKKSDTSSGQSPKSSE